MRICLLTLIALFITNTSFASQEIPNHLVGVWVSEDAKLEGEILHEGGAVYLDKNGEGALIVGPPAMGYVLNASFDEESNEVKVDLIEQGKVIGQKVLNYNAEKKTLIFQGDDRPLYRKFDEFSNAAKKMLGM